jgi:hypothetical protein
MDIEKEIVVVESVGGIDGPLACEDVVTNNLDTGSVWPTPNNSLENEVLQLAAIQAQTTF